jgi:hypothetical protein
MKRVVADEYLLFKLYFRLIFKHHNFLQLVYGISEAKLFSSRNNRFLEVGKQATLPHCFSVIFVVSEESRISDH